MLFTISTSIVILACHVAAQEQVILGPANSRHNASWEENVPSFSPKLRRLFAQSYAEPYDQWSGFFSFAHATPVKCFGKELETPFDVAVIGAPFDTTTSYRPGTRFGPSGIRHGSYRLSVDALNVPMGLHVGEHLNIVDCGDVPMVPIDNKVALRQLQNANADLLSKPTSHQWEGKSLAKDGKFHPRILTLGGDHTITLPLLRGVAEIYGPVSVIHFDSHIDTWFTEHPQGEYPWLPGEEIPVHHGSYFYYAHKEGLLGPNNTNIHVGIRGPMAGWKDYEDDKKVGFVISHADDLEEIGWRGVVKKIRDTVGDNPVYISLDIDVMDPSVAPATGTPEIGGITNREIKKIMQGLRGLKIVGADIVEVAPVYDTQDEITSITAASIGWDILALMALTPIVE